MHAKLSQSRLAPHLTSLQWGVAEQVRHRFTVVGPSDPSAKIIEMSITLNTNEKTDKERKVGHLSDV